MSENQSEEDKLALIRELQNLGIKNNPDKIIRIAKNQDNKIIFLEEGKVGNRGSGLLHILERHRDDFIRRGITEKEIPDLIISAIIEGTLIGYQGQTPPPREIYEVVFKNQTQYIAVSIGNNGYIVGANPTTP